MEEKERTVYVVYVTGKGFIKKTPTGGSRHYVNDFMKARIYNKAGHAKSSLSRGESENAHVIPVKMTLDPKDVFVAIMGFS